VTAEPGAPNFTEPLAAELHQMADWLSLHHIQVTATSPAAKSLTQHL
jgi:uncharacterized protein